MRAGQVNNLTDRRGERGKPSFWPAQLAPQRPTNQANNCLTVAKHAGWMRHPPPSLHMHMQTG